MFEVTDSDIERLSDAELRSLVVRLATSELRKHGLPLSSITAGGHQDAPDGGLDVRVACPIAIPSPDFVPRQHTGFQVKKPDMTAGKIRDEMSPGGKLRAVITDLATQRGAYIIVSAQGSVADKPLQERRQAMRDQLIGLMKPEDLHTDFYDRDRLTTNILVLRPGSVRSLADRLMAGAQSTTGVARIARHPISQIPRRAL